MADNKKRRILASDSSRQRSTRKYAFKKVSLRWGDWKLHSWAIAYPVLVLGFVAAIAYFFGAIDSRDTNWSKTFINMGLMSSTGVILVMITEEGFFAADLGQA